MEIRISKGDDHRIRMTLATARDLGEQCLRALPLMTRISVILAVFSEQDDREEFIVQLEDEP